MSLVAIIAALRYQCAMTTPEFIHSIYMNIMFVVFRMQKRQRSVLVLGPGKDQHLEQ